MPNDEAVPNPDPKLGADDAPAEEAAARPEPDMAALMVRLAEIRRDVEGPPSRGGGRALAWLLGGAIGLLLATLLFGKGACLP